MPPLHRSPSASRPPRLALALALALGAAVAGAACKKDEAAEPPAPPAPATLTTGTVGSGGVRTVEVEVREAGYAPDRIPGRPGESLILRFTRRVDGMCYEELKTPDGKVRPLPKDQPVDVAITVPASGALKFTCGMDMLSGVVVSESA